MANASPQVFLVDGEWLWKWIGRARGQNKDEIFLPGRAGPAAAGAKAAKAGKGGCLPVLIACTALVASALLCVQALS